MPFGDIFQSMKCVKIQKQDPMRYSRMLSKNPGIFYPVIFQKLKSRDFWSRDFWSRDFWSRDFLISGLSRNITGPKYPIRTSNLKPLPNRYKKQKSQPTMRSDGFK